MAFALGRRIHLALLPPRYLALPLSGIDISTSSVKGVRLVERLRGLELAAYAEERLPPGAFVDGEFTDPVAIAAAVVAVAARIGARRANAALPGTKSYLFEAVVSGIDRKEVRVSIAQHLEELIPLPSAEAMFDFVPIRAVEGGTLVSGVGFARRAVDQVLTAFDAARLQAGSLDSETFAMTRALLPAGDISTTLIIDIGKTTTKLAIVEAGVLRFAITFGTGGHAFTLAVQKYFGVTETEARHVKAERGVAPSPGNEEYLAAMLSIASVIRDEIQRHLDYWQSHTASGHGHAPVSRALLVGGNGAIRGLSEYLERSLGIPVATGDVFVNFASRDDWIPELDYTESLGYATAIGLALRDALAQGASATRLELLPPERRHLLYFDYVFRLASAGLSLAAVLALVGLVLLAPAYAYLASAHTTDEARLASVEATLTSSDDVVLTSRLDALTAAASTLSMLASAPTASEDMRTALAIGRPGVTISDLSYTAGSGSKGGTLAISGIAASRNDLRAYQLALSSSALFSSADLPVSTYAKESDIPFTMTATVARSAL